MAHSFLEENAWKIFSHPFISQNKNSRFILTSIHHPISHPILITHADIQIEYFHLIDESSFHNEVLMLAFLSVLGKKVWVERVTL